MRAATRVFAARASNILRSFSWILELKRDCSQRRSGADVTNFNGRTGIENLKIVLGT